MDRARSIDTLTAIARSRVISWRDIAPMMVPGLAWHCSRGVELADAIDGAVGFGDGQGGRRPRQGTRRPHRVEFSLTSEEFELLGAAAGRAGRARGAYAAEVTLAAARGEDIGGVIPCRSSCVS